MTNKFILVDIAWTHLCIDRACTD